MRLVLSKYGIDAPADQIELVSQIVALIAKGVRAVDSRREGNAGEVSARS
jgi:hypothetical protein